MSSKNDSIQKTLLVAFVLCIVCSVLVSGAAVLLKPAQQKNKALDKMTNILLAAGMYEEGVPVVEQFKLVKPRVVDLETGTYTEAVDPTSYDQRKAAKDPALSVDLSADEDVARIGRQEKYAVVYIVENGDGIEKLILPVKGYALWSTLYGFLALDSDFNTVAGLGFYEHAETPGLGGEIDNPNWKAKWVGKQVYNDQNNVAIGVIKGAVDESKPNAEYQIDGLSGATLTSKGVDNLIKFWMGENGFAPFIANLKRGDA
ncbi:MAG: Na(+)-translocating NADH-quinone reductase subunit C [bacterium]